VVNVGTMALEDGGRVDFTRLRQERRARVLAAMEAEGLDALLLGREPNARYVSGARRLFVAGTRPFAPGCVLVRSTGALHLMSTWEDGVPPEVPREHLYGTTWNPMHLMAALGRIEGLPEARRVGVDGMTPLFAQLLRGVMPEATFVDATPALRALRRRKTADEVSCIRTAVAIAEAASLAVADAIRPGVRERELVGVLEAHLAAFGITTPAAEGLCCVADPVTDGDVPRLRQLPSDRTVEAGDLVAVRSGALYAGYEGTVGRTWPCRMHGSEGRTPDQRVLAARWSAVWAELRDACRPGASGADLRAAYERSGEPLPPFPIAYSAGLGYDEPVAGSHLGTAAEEHRPLEPDTVLVVQAHVAGPAGGWYGAETVLLTAEGCEPLTTLAIDPSGG